MENKEMRGMLDYVESIDPLNGKNVARYAAQHFTDNGDGTMTIRRFLPYSIKPINVDACKEGWISLDGEPQVHHIDITCTVAEYKKRYEESEKPVDIMAVTRGMCK